MDLNTFDIIVVGAGPAGMTAALNILRAGKTVLILEGESFGGQISFSPRVENFPSYPSVGGAELMDKLYEQISDWGAQIELEQVEMIDKTPFGFKVRTNYNSYECKSVILATGVKPRKIGVPREDELVGHGVSYCALCDGAFYAGDDVAVVGDANTALQYALVLSGYCKTVHIVTLFDKFFGDIALVDKVVEQPNVKVYHNFELKKFVADDELSGLIFENTADKSILSLDVKAAFICIGQVPTNSAFKNLVELDKNGYIVADESCATSCAGIYVAGDCRTKSIRQLVTAASDGSIAAFYSCQYIDTK
ncbi:MAG: FAD-dependent oxidoreductase [Clostridia bacterium]